MDKDMEKIGEALEDIVNLLSEMSMRLENIEKRLENRDFSETKNISEIKQYEGFKEDLPTSMDILELQESRPGVFRTYKAIQRDNKWHSAQDIADITQRSRGLESRYLNELAELGIIDKKRAKVEKGSRITEVLFKVKELSS